MKKRKPQKQNVGPHLPVDGLAGEAISLVPTMTGAVNKQSRLVTVCVLVTATVIL